MPDPIICVDDVAFPRFRAPDLDEMERFLRSFGMHTAARTDEALYARGTDPEHHVHVTHLGEPAFLGLAFSTDRTDLDTLSAATGVPVEELDEPGGGVAVHLHDPDGRIVDVVADIDRLEPLEVLGHAPLNLGVARTRVDELQRVPTGASQVKRFGHAAIKTTSLADGGRLVRRTRSGCSPPTTCTWQRPRSPSAGSCGATAATGPPTTTACSSSRPAR